MAKNRDGLGGLFRRRSRHTGEVLPTWWARYSVDCTQVRISTGTDDREAALDFLREKLGKIARREEHGVDRQRLTVKDICDTLIEKYERKKKASLKTGARATAKLWTDTCGDVRAVTLTTRMVARILADWKAANTRRGRPATDATCNRRLAFLRRTYRVSKLMVDPAKLDFADLWERESDPRDVYMSPSDFAKILKHLPAYFKDFFSFAYYTGARRGQIASMKWEHVDTTQWVIQWPSPSTKAKKPQVLALAGMPLEIIQRRWKSRTPGCEYVFDRGGKPIKDFRKIWKKALDAAGFDADAYRFHDTRRASVTHTVETGASASVAMAVSGHRTRSMLDRYSLPLLAAQRAALERSSAHVQAMTTPKKKAAALRRRSSR